MPRWIVWWNSEGEPVFKEHSLGYPSKDEALAHVLEDHQYSLKETVEEMNYHLNKMGNLRKRIKNLISLRETLWQH